MATSEEEKIAKEEQEWEKDKTVLDRKLKIEEEKDVYRQRKRKRISTTKWLIFFLFFNCTIIELFVGWCTVQSLIIARETGAYVDYSPLVTVIGAVVSEVIGYAVYAIKSAKENCAGGIQYDLAMRDNPPYESTSDETIAG